MSRSNPRAHQVRGALWYAKVTVAALLALAGIMFAFLALQPNPSGVPVLVTKRDLTAGETPVASDFRVVQVPKDAVPSTALASFEATEGAPVRRDVEARTVVTEEMVATSGAGVLPRGFSQVAVVPPSAGQLLEVGDEVEVWGEELGCENTECPIVKLTAPAVVVLIEEASTGAFEPEQSSVLHLQIPSRDVGKVLQAAKGGSIHFVLRAPSG